MSRTAIQTLRLSHFRSYKAAMLVRRLPDATVQEFHRLRTHILMDAGELGSRHMTVTWIDVPEGVQCIEVEVTWPDGSLVVPFDVTPGATETLAIYGLDDVEGGAWFDANAWDADLLKAFNVPAAILP